MKTYFITLHFLFQTIIIFELCLYSNIFLFLGIIEWELIFSLRSRDKISFGSQEYVRQICPFWPIYEFQTLYTLTIASGCIFARQIWLYHQGADVVDSN